MREHSHCHPANPGIVCHGRYEAVHAGRFFWDMKLNGYISLDLPVREQSSAARWYGGERGVEDHSGEPYKLELCPWCGMELPTLFPDKGEMATTDGADNEC